MAVNALLMGRKYPWSMRLIFIGGIILLCSVWLTNYGSGKTITVDDDGPADYSTISEAINVAEEGDTVYVYDGVYNETIEIWKSKIQLRGETKENTIIDRSNLGGNVISIYRRDILVENFTILNNGEFPWACIFLFHSSTSQENVTVKNCNFRNAYLGIKIYESCNNNIVENCSFSESTGGVRLKGCNNISVINSTFQNNTNYGISTDHVSNVIIDNCIIENGQGRGITNFIDCDDIIIKNSIIQNNSKEGIYFYSHSSGNSIIKCSIMSNGGDGIYIYNWENYNYSIRDSSISKNGMSGIDINCDDCEIVNCTVSQNGNNGIIIIGSSVVDRCTITENAGCGVQVEGTLNKVSNSIFQYNNLSGVNIDNRYNDVSANDFIHDGIFTLFAQNTISNNRLNGKMIYYLTNLNGFPVHFDDLGQLIVIYCRNLRLRDFFIEHAAYGIIIYESDMITIENITIDNCSNYAIFGNNCDDLNILSLQIENSSNSLYLQNCNMLTVAFLDIRQSQEGASLHLSQCNDAIINDVNIINCDIGISCMDAKNIQLNRVALTRVNSVGMEIRSSSDFFFEDINFQDISNSAIHLTQSSGIIFQFCRIENCSTGIEILMGSENITVQYVNFIRNRIFAINATENIGHTINASDNWWDDKSGPFHSTANPSGKGASVTDGVDFIPWSTREISRQPFGRIESVIPEESISGENVEFTGNGTDLDGQVILYVWWSSFDGELYNGSESKFNTSGLSIGYHTIKLRLCDNSGYWSQDINTSIVVTPDLIPPLLSVNYPEETIHVNGSIVIIGVAQDNIMIERVEYRIGSTSTWSIAAGKENWSIEINTTAFDDGEYRLELRAYDGIQYSDIQPLTLIVKHNKEVENDDGDDDSSLFDDVGPLAVIGYIAIIVVIIGSVVSIIVRKG